MATSCMFTSGEFSRAECDRQIESLFTTNYGFRTGLHGYKANIQQIVSFILEKYSRLGNPGELLKFKAACEKPFTFPKAAPDSPRNTVTDDSSEPDVVANVTQATPVQAPPATPVSILCTPDAPSTARTTHDTTNSMTRSGRSKPVTPSKVKKL
ncbi:hypothetical protein SNE40_005100 [Patella caerulea]|uniref:Uncharacterized protein n=1 Tax=Patella caerulea TaxID=87958 RepID=A0AAN8K4C8_PATCE